MKRVVRVVGARPQYMQVPSLQRALEEHGCEHILIHTGQHYDPTLAESIMREIGLGDPALNLHVGSGSHAQQTAQIMMKLETALTELHPDFVIVDGDTNSTLATALVTSKLRIPLLHVEAGVRDFFRDRPEEVNRVLTDHASELNVAPVPRALVNLQREGLGEISELVGDLLLDSFLQYLPRASDSVRNELSLKEGAYNLVTLHRPETTSPERFDRFETILKFIGELGVPAVFPCHPRVKTNIERVKGLPWCKQIKFLPPVSYLEMLGLLRGAHTVFTDSGGLSREAAWMGSRTLMLFSVDTWHDLLERSWAQIAKGGLDSIEQAYGNLKPASALEARSLFGSGQAANKIVFHLKRRNWI